MIAVMMTASFTQSLLAEKGGDQKVNPAVLAAFSKDFIFTSDANWRKTQDVFVVNFMQSGESYTAYYTEDGLLNSISNHVDKSKLPELVTKKIEKKYSHAEILNVLLVRSVADGVSYVIHIAAGSQERIIKADADGAIENIKKIK